MEVCLSQKSLAEFGFQYQPKLIWDWGNNKGIILKDYPICLLLENCATKKFAWMQKSLLLERSGKGVETVLRI